MWHVSCLKMLVRLSTFLFFAVTLQAQPAFQNLAPNFDGAALYFSAALRLKGTDQYPHPKIFVWEAGTGVRLYAQQPPTNSSRAWNTVEFLYAIQSGRRFSQL